MTNFLWLKLRTYQAYQHQPCSAVTTALWRYGFQRLDSGGKRYKCSLQIRCCRQTTTSVFGDCMVVVASRCGSSGCTDRKAGCSRANSLPCCCGISTSRNNSRFPCHIPPGRRIVSRFGGGCGSAQLQIRSAGPDCCTPVFLVDGRQQRFADDRSVSDVLHHDGDRAGATTIRRALDQSLVDGLVIGVKQDRRTERLPAIGDGLGHEALDLVDRCLEHPICGVGHGFLPTGSVLGESTGRDTNCRPRSGSRLRSGSR
ncbi:hypothetical protein L346_02658 [Pseudomonas aeruginosa MSH-10]|nr:hypothetical protein L346_02658 [Pseudomonas aeruginosa MSH-10]ERX70917.1 hypothetical protein P999_01744 [Pseudomonas aeruginosa MSH3]ERZ39329.1 hypothetical protein Q000_02658 [Pseudomonas aeruginosa MSH10]